MIKNDVNCRYFVDTPYQIDKVLFYSKYTERIFDREANEFNGGWIVFSDKCWGSNWKSIRKKRSVNSNLIYTKIKVDHIRKVKCPSVDLEVGQEFLHIVLFVLCLWRSMTNRTTNLFCVSRTLSFQAWYANRIVYHVTILVLAFLLRVIL